MRLVAFTCIQHHVGAKLVLKAVCSGPEALADERLAALDHIMNSNLGMAHYKTKDFSKCVMYCDKALLRRKTMPADLLKKNLYRKASAEYELHNFETCMSVCQDLLSIFPNNAAAQQLLRTTERDIAAASKVQKKVYAKLFDKLDQENRGVIP
jgi:hypothetical protein